ncbi:MULTISPECIES: malonic semialdehyde reductase [unclassified Sphingopyxis]|jgi:3-hydroxypropanoate dehydrogenase|uniref:malonic semialdehyde reductase n=1 Tax=unclassified Sphingopyxis TaxID=2614943 RepID=UPI0006C278A0|nr:MULTISPECIES: malonic semialdehyde reductase [unclassified Sphingopyxis]USI75813.1 malonic semialdehyde reductase [Sphingopyxis sp. USTB-05]GAO77649.1 predicted reductase RutE in novel pyrimidine catabolism pathway [Sphingopyxis sp. C-1]
MSEPLSDSALDQLFRTARTYNGYLDKPVSETQLHAIWDLVKFGPTSANSLPARIVWCVSDEAKQKVAAFALPANAEKILAAPVTAIIASDNEFYENLPELFPHTDARSWFVGNDALAQTTAFRNSSLQGAYFILAARALGLDTGPMSGFNNAAVDEAFFADQPHVKSNFISTLGYGDPATIFERSPRPDFARFNRIA